MGSGIPPECQEGTIRSSMPQPLPERLVEDKLSVAVSSPEICPTSQPLKKKERPRLNLSRWAKPWEVGEVRKCSSFWSKVFQKCRNAFFFFLAQKLPKTSTPQGGSELRSPCPITEVSAFRLCRWAAVGWGGWDRFSGIQPA